jgi:hypothetical protein
MICCLVFSGFASPAAANTIVVTTLIDTADPPFNADGLCGTGTVSDLPGADGLISLREAIIAANNTLGEDLTAFAQSLSGGVGSPDGRAGAIANNNQTHVIVRHNTVEGSTVGGIEVDAGAFGLASANTTEVWVAHNTICNNTGTDIRAEGGFTGNVIFPVPNAGTGNVLTGQIFQNTATTVTVADGAPGNTADVTQFNNDPCP